MGCQYCGGYGLEVRAAVHVGEIEAVGGRVSGLAVHEAARIAAAASPGEILVSQTTMELAAGAGLAFTDRGPHPLKGIPHERRLFAVAEAELSD